MSTLYTLPVDSEEENEATTMCDVTSPPPATTNRPPRNLINTVIIAGSVVGSVVVVLLSVAIVLLLVIIVRQSKVNKLYTNNDIDLSSRFSNPIYDGKLQTHNNSACALIMVLLVLAGQMEVTHMCGHQYLQVHFHLFPMWPYQVTIMYGIGQCMITMKYPLRAVVKEPKLELATIFLY